MQDLLKTIDTLMDMELQELMVAIAYRYGQIFPAWEMFYMAIHKDPQLRRQDLAHIRALMELEGQSSH